jgi:hypothetical protein
MIITAFGGLFLPFSLFVFLFRRSWLLSLLCVAAVLQSPSVANFAWRGATYGITPFLWACGLVLADFVWGLRRKPLLRHGGSVSWRALVLWAAFCAVALLSALVLPWMFAGVDVYSPLAKEGIAAKPVSLTWTISHLAQMMNMGMILFVMLWVVNQDDDANLARRAWIGVVAALVVSTAIGLQQRLGWNGLIPMWEGFWASNPTYDQNPQSWADIRRVSWPLVDASYGSTWYAVLFGGFAAMFLVDVQRNRALLGALIALFALGNSLGEAGVLSLVIYCALALVALAVTIWRWPQWRGGVVYRLSLAGLAGCCVALAVYLVLRRHGLVGEAGTALTGIVQRWTDYLFGHDRLEADAHALGLLKQTWGLGVGMGSNRASSYVTTLIGNTGVLGAVLFFAAFAYQMKILFRVCSRSAEAVFFFGASITALIAVTIAVPDQNWPVFWIMILGGLACIASPGPVRSDASETAEIGRHMEAHDRTI